MRFFAFAALAVFAALPLVGTASLALADEPKQEVGSVEIDLSPLPRKMGGVLFALNAWVT